MERIGGTIARINAIAAAVAAAVDQQNATTHGIAQNVQSAAHGTRLVSDKVAEPPAPQARPVGRRRRCATTRRSSRAKPKRCAVRSTGS